MVMFRPRIGPSALRRLAALPSGSHVRLHLGSIYVKAVRRWLPAGVIPLTPIGPKALLRLNAGAFPTVLVPAAGTPYGESW